MQTMIQLRQFYTTINKVFKILEENGESFQDDLLLKVNDRGNFILNLKVK